MSNETFETDFGEPQGPTTAEIIQLNAIVRIDTLLRTRVQSTDDNPVIDLTGITPEDAIEYRAAFSTIASEPIFVPEDIWGVSSIVFKATEDAIKNIPLSD